VSSPPAGSSKGAPVIARTATYRATSGDPHDLARRAEAEILPLFRKQHGFRAYSLAVDGKDILSLTVWDSLADAEAGNDVAAAFVAERMSGEIELVEKRMAEIAFSTTLGLSTLATASA
jgi:heme-degrading monooxygenase HmoA